MRRLLVAAAGAALLLAAAAPARADQAIAELGRDAPVAGYGGWEAWSSFDESTQRYTLMLRAPDDTLKAAPLTPSSKPFDMSLGPDAHGDVVAIYRRCTSHGCDLRRLYVATGRDQALNSVSSSTYSEATPAIWKSNVVFTRRVDGCDVPYFKDLSSSAGSRRMLKSKCLQTPAGQTSIRGTRIMISSVDESATDSHGAGRKVAEVRRYLATQSGSQVLLSQAFGEESDLFGQVAQDDRYTYTVRIGVHPANTFVRVPVGGGAAQEVRAFRNLTSGFAKPSANEALYVETQDIDIHDCDGSTRVPCRLVLAPSNPFGGAQRTLTPLLTVAYTGQPRRGQPLTFNGQLTRQVVAGDSVVRIDPQPGVTVELYHRSTSSPETFTATGDRGVTGPDGSYAITLPAVGADVFYTGVASTPDISTWAGRGTVGSVSG